MGWEEAVRSSVTNAGERSVVCCQWLVWIPGSPTSPMLDTKDQSVLSTSPRALNLVKTSQREDCVREFLSGDRLRCKVI